MGICSFTVVPAQLRPRSHPHLRQKPGAKGKVHPTSPGPHKQSRTFLRGTVGCHPCPPIKACCPPCPTAPAILGFAPRVMFSAAFCCLLLRCSPRLLHNQESQTAQPCLMANKKDTFPQHKPCLFNFLRQSISS